MRQGGPYSNVHTTEWGAVISESTPLCVICDELSLKLECTAW